MTRYSRLQCQRCGVDIHDGDSRLCDICWSEEEESLEAWSDSNGYLDWLGQMDEMDRDEVDERADDEYFKFGTRYPGQ